MNVASTLTLQDLNKDRYNQYDQDGGDTDGDDNVEGDDDDDNDDDDDGTDDDDDVDDDDDDGVDGLRRRFLRYTLVVYGTLLDGVGSMLMELGQE